MNGVLQKREVTTTISYVGAVPEFKKMKNMLLERNFVLERADNIKYVKEEDVSVKTAKIWNNLDISNDDSFDY